MDELSGRMTHLAIDYSSGLPVISIAINEKNAATACYDRLKDCDKITVKIGKHRNKRSNDANAYLWVLCSKIGEAIREDKDEVYRRAVKAVGIYREQGQLPIDFAKTSRHAWEMLGVGWLTEQVDFEQDRDHVIVRYYYGTSTYNTKQMSRVIDWLVAECGQLGIDTKTPDELADMLSLWGSGGNG